MIGWIKGTIIEKKAPELLLNVNGIGYEIQAPMSTFYTLPEQGEVELFTHFVVREDAQLLFGFATKSERKLFRAVIKVNGIGPKLGLTILSSIEADRFVHCVHEQDVQALTKVPGIGKKTAERLLVEMKDKLNDWYIDVDAVLPGFKNSDNSSMSEAESALIALGYKPTEAHKMAVKASTQDGANSAEELIRLALRSLNS
ncbi:MAG: Holliday junction branch migration protein RuvA [Sinobacterium sp.]|nr:Holliday junction branch migration protein RuvA [Sinobacterium sp.]